MGNRDLGQIREFGTGLRDYLELHGARLDVHATAVATADLFALFAEPAGARLVAFAPPQPMLASVSAAVPPVAVAA